MCLMIVSGLLSGTAFGQDEYVEGALYVKLKPGTVQYTKSPNRNYPVSNLLSSKRSSLISCYAIKKYAYSMHLFDSEYLDNVFRIEFDSIRLTQQLIDELKKDDKIEFIEKVPMQTIPAINHEDPTKMFLNFNNKDKERADMPNDVFIGTIDEVHTSWFLDLVGFDEVYGAYSGNPDIKVAVVDNAVWGDHEDLQIAYDNLYDTFWSLEGDASPPKWVQQDEEPSIGPSVAYGWSHGTHCAGVIGALTNNHTGIPSIGAGITLMGVKTAENSDKELSRTVQGVIWAAENGAKIISMSYGSPNHSEIERKVYETCVAEGIIMIAAAGNNGRDMVHYPSNYAGVISVASVNSDMKRSGFSNYGAWVDIAAPGGYYVKEGGVIDTESQIFSTTYCVNQILHNKEAFRGQYYDMMNGTSMATPITASVAALIASYYPELNGYQMLELLQRSSGKVPQADLPIAENSGVVNVSAALALAERLQDKYVRDLTATFNPSSGNVVLTWAAPEEAIGLLGYTIYKRDTLIEANTDQLTYTIPVQSTTTNISYGVKALYETEDGLTAYTAATELTEIADRDEPSADLFRIYLSASRQTLYIAPADMIRFVSIFDMQGRMVLEIPYDTKGVNISSLIPGIYILQARYDAGVASVKFRL